VQHAYWKVWQLPPRNSLLHHSKTQPSRLAHPGESRASGSGGPISSVLLREQQLQDPPPAHTKGEKQHHAPLAPRPNDADLALVSDDALGPSLRLLIVCAAGALEAAPAVGLFNRSRHFAPGAGLLVGTRSAGAFSKGAVPVVALASDAVELAEAREEALFAALRVRSGFDFADLALDSVVGLLVVAVLCFGSAAFSSGFDVPALAPFDFAGLDDRDLACFVSGLCSFLSAASFLVSPSLPSATGI